MCGSYWELSCSQVASHNYLIYPGLCSLWLTSGFVFWTTSCLGSACILLESKFGWVFSGTTSPAFIWHDSYILSVLNCSDNEDNCCRASPVAFPSLILSCGWKDWKLRGRAFARWAGVVEVEMRHCLGQIGTLACFDCNKDNVALGYGWINTRFFRHSDISVSIVNTNLHTNRR